MTTENKTPKLCKKHWKKIAPDLVHRLKEKINIRTTEKKLELILKSASYAKEVYPELPRAWWRNLILKLIEHAKRGGYSSELYEVWLNTRDITPSGSRQTLNRQGFWSPGWDKIVDLAP